MGVYVEEKTDAFKDLVQSVHKGEEKQIRQSLESLLTAIALESDSAQVDMLKNFVNSITFNLEMVMNKTSGQQIRYNLTNYGYQLD